MVRERGEARPERMPKMSLHRPSVKAKAREMLKE